MKSICLSIILLLVCGNSFGITAEEVLKKMAAVYEKASNYEVHLKYELFKGTSSKIASSYEGLLSRSNENVYQKIDQTEFIATPKFSLKISHSEDIVEVDEGSTFTNQTFDVKTTMKECKSMEVTEKDEFYYVEMNLKNSSQVPYSQVVLKINKSNFHIHQMDLYYWHFENFSEDPKEEELDKPHLRIYYYEFSKRTSLDASVFEFKTYFTSQKSEDGLVGKYKNYTLIDNRTKQ